MIESPLAYSQVFAYENEQSKFFARKKKSLCETFKFNVERSLDRMYGLAFWLHVYKRNEEAIVVCDFLMQKEFEENSIDNVSHWYHVGKAIGLKYVIENQMYDYPKEHFSYVQRIFDADEANVRFRAKDEKSVEAYARLHEGFLNGQIIETALWNKDIYYMREDKAWKVDTCYATIRESCWLIATNEYLGRVTFYLGGQSGNISLFWDKYYMYLDEIRRLKKVT